MRVLALAVPHARVAQLLGELASVMIALVAVIPLVAIAVALVVPIHAEDNARTGVVLLVLIHAEALVGGLVQHHAQQHAERPVLEIAVQIVKTAVKLLALHLVEPDALDAVEHAQEFAPDAVALARTIVLLAQAVLVTVMELAGIKNAQQFARMRVLPPRMQRLMLHAVTVLAFVKMDVSLAPLPALEIVALAVPVVAILGVAKLAEMDVVHPAVLDVTRHAEKRVREDAPAVLEHVEITVLEIVGRPVKLIAEVHVLRIAEIIAVRLVGKIAGQTVLRYVPHLVGMLVQTLAPQDALEIVNKTVPLVARNHARAVAMIHVADNVHHARTIALLVALELVLDVLVIAPD